MSQKAVTDALAAIEQKTSILNPYNKLKNATFKNNFTSWTTQGTAPTIKNNDLPADSLVWPGVYCAVNQYISKNNLPSGFYTISAVWEKGETGRIEVLGIDSNYGEHELTRITYSLPSISFNFDSSSYIQLLVRFIGGNTGDTMSRPLLIPSDAPEKLFYLEDWNGVIDAATQVSSIQTQLDNLESDFLSSGFVNPDNLIPGNTFQDLNVWTTAAENATIIPSGLPCNNLKLSFTSSSSPAIAWLRQIFLTNKMSTGDYYLSMDWVEGENGYIEVIGYKADYSETSLKKVFINTTEEDKIFNIDTSVFTRIEIRIALGNPDTIVVTSPILVPIASSHQYYNTPYEVTFQAVNKINNLGPTISPLTGLVLAANGDSIAEGSSSNGGYVRLIAEKYSMSYQNIARGGGTITPVDGAYSIVSGTPNLRSDADIILLEGGVNDTYYLNSNTIELGTIDSTYLSTYDTSTFCSSFQKMIVDTIKRFPGKTIIYISPHNHGNWKPGNPIYDSAIALCEKWSIPVCNLTISSAPLGRLSVLFSQYTNNGDTQHPNEQGYSLFYTSPITSTILTHLPTN